VGLLNVNAGIPICETSPMAPASQFTWQGLVMLKREIRMQWQATAYGVHVATAVVMAVIGILLLA
jgi:hypothetical protein